MNAKRLTAVKVSAAYTAIEMSARNHNQAYERGDLQECARKSESVIKSHFWYSEMVPFSRSPWQHDMAQERPSGYGQLVHGPAVDDAYALDSARTRRVKLIAESLRLRMCSVY